MDRSYLQNPMSTYFQWMKTKLTYQWKYRAGHLRIGYMSSIRNVKFGRYNWTGERVHIENSTIGDFTYFSNNCVILEASIGKFCSFGPNILVAPGKHPTRKFVSTHPALFSNPTYCLKNFFDKDHHNPDRHVIIGNDVWICANVVIADGVKIGDGVVVGANSVVTKDIEPYSIVGGIPAKFIRKRFDQESVDILLKTKWWDKDLSWIEKHKENFLDINTFIKMDL